MDSEPASFEEETEIETLAPEVTSEVSLLRRSPESAPQSGGVEGKVDLKIATLDLDDEGNPKTEYYAGEIITPYATLEPSGNGLKIINPKLKITFPKAYVNGEPPFPMPESATSITKFQDSNNWMVTYSFDQLIGGKRIDIPIPFKMNNYNNYPLSTPNNFNTTIKMELFDQEGTLIIDTSTTYINKNYDNSLGVYSFGSHSPDYRGEIGNDGDRLYTATINVYNTGAMLLTADGEGAPRFRQSITIGATGTDLLAFPIGRYLPRIVNIKVQLPEGVILGGSFQTSGAYSGYYSYKYGGRSPVYRKFDEATHTAFYSGGLHGGERTVPILVRYPNFSYKDDDGNMKIYKNTTIVTLDPGTPYEKILTPKTIGLGRKPNLRPMIEYLNFKKEGYNSSMGITYESAEYEKEPPFSYRISIQDGYAGDTSREKYYLYNLVDHDLNSHLYYKAIKLQQWNGISTEKKFSIWGVKSDDSEVKLGENLAIGTWLPINDSSAEYKNLKITFEEPVLMSGSLIEFYLLTAIRNDQRADLESGYLVDKTVNNWGNVELTPKQFKNFADLTFSNIKAPDETYTKSTRGRIFYVKDYSVLVFQKINGDYTVAYSSNNKRTIEQQIYLAKDTGMTRSETGKKNIVAKGVKVLSLLPSGIEYVPGSTRLQNPKSVETIMPDLNIKEPQIINNYQDSGKTALIFDLGDIRRGREFVGYGNNNIYGPKELNSRLQFDVDVTKYTAIGKNIIESYEIGDRSQDIDVVRWINSPLVTDQYDYNNNGDITDKIRKINLDTTINFVPAREIILRNALSNMTGSNFSNGSIFDKDEQAYYKFSIFNNSLVPASNLSVINVFPVPGDHAIVANKDGNYLPRNSEFTVGISQSLESLPENTSLLDDWQILYSLDPQGDDIDATKSAHFVSAGEISDFKQVKMIKIVQKAGSSLPEGKTADFIFPAYVPDKDTGGKLLTAIGSSAFSTDGFNYIEGNQTRFQLVNTYRIDGKVFADANKDGALSGDAGLKGYTLILMNIDGTPVKDSNGAPITAQTDQDGNYQIQVLKRGQYYLTMKKKAATDKETKLYEEEGVILVGSGGNDASLDPDDTTEMTLKSPLFTLNPFSISDLDNVLQKPSSMIATRNFGLILSNGKIAIKVVDSEDETKGLFGATFEIRDSSGVLVATVTSNENGEITTETLPFDNYNIQQIDPPKDYTLNNEIFTLNLAGDNAELTVTNTKKPIPSNPGYSGGGGSSSSTSTPKDPDKKPESNPTIPSQPKNQNTGTPSTQNSSTKSNEPDPIIYRTETQTPAKESLSGTAIKKWVKVLPKTGVGDAISLIKKVGIIPATARTTIATALPNAKTFKLAGNTSASLNEWLQILPEKDRNADKYLILPTQGLIIPIVDVEETSKAYKNFTNGISENFVSYLHNGAVELPGTSINSYGSAGNKVIAGHSSYWKNSQARYKTHFQKIIGMEKGEQIWIYKKNKTKKTYDKYSYTVDESYNTKPTDIAVLYPTSTDQITLITCTPIGGVAGRRIVKATASK